MVLTALGVNAQRKGDFLACTGNNVNVRTGPGLNYRVQTHYDNQKVQLMKGAGVGDGDVIAGDVVFDRDFLGVGSGDRGEDGASGESE